MVSGRAGSFQRSAFSGCSPVEGHGRRNRLPPTKAHLEIQPQAQRDDARTVLWAAGPPEAGAADRAVYAEIRPVKRVESVGSELQPHTASVAARPHVHLLDQRRVIHQDRGLAELAVVLRGRSERELAGDREGGGVEIDDGNIYFIRFYPLPSPLPSSAIPCWKERQRPLASEV
jgi:hypothetical protein